MWVFFFSSRRRHTRCALVTGVQTCALPISTGLQLVRYDFMNKHSATADLHEAAPLTGLALSNWMRTLAAYVRSGEPDLTNRQMALMMVVYNLPGHPPVRGLADKLNVSKPVITRALHNQVGRA